MTKTEPSAPDLEDRHELISQTHEVHQDIPYAIHLDENESIEDKKSEASASAESIMKDDIQEQSRKQSSVLSEAPENDMRVPLQQDDGIKRGEWDVGLFNCYHHCVPNCWMTVFCPYVSLAQILSRMGMLSYPVALVIMLLLGFIQGGAGSFNSNSFFTAANADEVYDTYRYSFASYVIVVAYIATGIITWQIRTKVRERFEIPGSCFSDFIAVIVCSQCVICQIATHVKSYKPGTCDFGPQDTLPAYTY